MSRKAKPPPTPPKRRDPHALGARRLGHKVIVSKKRYRRKDRFPDPGSRSLSFAAPLRRAAQRSQNA